ncbi:flagellar hook assembly protein FlgD [Sphingobium sp. DEHP117]|uniref:flagellar hook assembly protein FlgD n=1 Tax=Sphingobium sp. DEHP117 TaxID=2993436 RepID=UPI0027D5D6FB|nr:flagellar hook capping FlgD N-terminal domain-containing protein [Sphingobium sp. DEHP117]MDQ4421124.1 flagellar hook assembly protein FlgD [Sphingobium sp. DEHP117]
MATNPIGASSAPAQPDTSLAKLSSDYTMFLRLLTTQMQNQDPLSPMDSSQYTQQLVQYSQVEQSIQQTGALKDILARLGSQDMMQASSLIGKQAAYDGAQAGLTTSTPAQWTWEADGAPASLVASIRDAAGREVERRTLNPNSLGLQWDGALSSGGAAPAGSYTLALDARDASGKALTPRIAAAGAVDSVSRTEDHITLEINGVSIPLSAVRIFTGANATP